MAQHQTIETTQQDEQPTAVTPPAALASEFGAEFRELARQRRFVRQSEAAGAAATTGAAPTPPAPPAAPPRPVAPTAAARVATPRLSDDQRAALAELARMSDRLVQSREALAIAVERTRRLEQDLSNANDRMMAARMLVREAQQQTRAAAERAEYLEGRCDMLQEALELAVHASFLTRWRWRRAQKAAQRTTT